MAYLQMQKISKKKVFSSFSEIQLVHLPLFISEAKQNFWVYFFYFKGFIELYLQCSAFLKRIICKDSYKNIKRNFDKYYQNFQLVI